MQIHSSSKGGTGRSRHCTHALDYSHGGTAALAAGILESAEAATNDNTIMSDTVLQLQ
jgi:hypothetical protein